ncbi:MAG: TlpA disulfide reductase family protein [Ferruginibacter sp.]
MKFKYLLLALSIEITVTYGQSIQKVMAIEDMEFNNYFLNKNNIPRISGKIINLSPSEIRRIKIDYTIVTPMDEFQVKKTSFLNTDGSFELPLVYAFPYQQVWISVDSLFYTGIYATSDLYLEFDAAVLKTQKDLSFNGPGVKYLGKDGALNDYTNNHILFRRKEQLEIDRQLQIILPTARTNYSAFIKKYDSLYTALSEIDNEFIQLNPSAFSDFLLNERLSNYFADLCVVHWGKQMPSELFEKIKSHKPFAISNDGMLFYNYLFIYLKLLAANKISSGNNFKTPTEGIIQTIKLLDSLFERSKADMFKIRFSSKDPKQYKQTIETTLPYINTVWCKNIIIDEYSKTLDKLDSIEKILNSSKPISSKYPLGLPIAELSFGARLYKVEGINADSLLTALKYSFKDKALLIDFWATWCTPCISQFPHSKKLSDESKDLPIEFIYLCTSESSDTDKWKTKIAEYKLSGTHIFVEKSIESSLMNIFSASGYPTYIFINRDGEYQPGVLKRPSELNKKELAELLK